ncbi:MAG: hypothetical protein KBB75_01215 [Candidatus Pacebacteria bacterium]|nr:hypothetical protein [Candidatus Paceibacterota bacterium]
MESFPQQKNNQELPGEFFLDVNQPVRELSLEEKEQDGEKNKDLPPPPTEEHNVI